MADPNIKFVLILSFCLLVTASSLTSLDEAREENGNRLEERLCSVMLKKPISELLVSEYNRAQSTNQWLYTISRDPYVACKDGDFSNCVIYIELVPSTCGRLSPNINCQPANEMYKTCVAAIDLVEAMPRENLKCLQDDDGDSPAEMSPMAALKILKKQWGFKGGNAYPI